MELLDEFSILSRFKFLQATEQMSKGSDGSFANIIMLEFVNDKHVKIDVVFIEGEYQITEPYAVDDDYLPVDKRELA